MDMELFDDDDGDEEDGDVDGDEKGVGSNWHLCTRSHYEGLISRWLDTSRFQKNESCYRALTSQSQEY